MTDAAIDPDWTPRENADTVAFNNRINAMSAFVQARCDEDELWAIEASRDDDNPVPDGGVHWQWIASEDDDIVTPDPATTDHVGDDAEGYGRDVSLRSVEEWPVRSSPGRTLPQFAIHTAEEVLPAVGGHIVRHDPTRALAEIKAKRELLDTVMAWEHDYHDDDTWFSCSQALLPAGQRTDPEDSEPGSGCSDDSRRGQPCDCGLDRRRTAILLPLATIWSDNPAFKPTWRTR